MVDLQEIGADLTARFTARAKSVTRATLTVKIVLVVGGSALIAAAQCVTLPALDKTPIWAAVGLVGTFFAFVGGIFLIFTEKDASHELAVAHKALEAAREAEADYAVIGDYADEIERSVKLYGACRLMITALQKMSPSVSMSTVATTLLDVAEWPLRVALGFQTADHWTVGVYQIEDRPTGRVLKAIAQMRSEKCDVANAREWPEGRGAGWIALANESELVIPDMSNEALGTIFDGSIDQADIEKYRSIVVSPIIVAGKKWGMVIATSDCANHFSLEDTDGARPTEAVGALQSMIVLALAARQLQAVTLIKTDPAQ